MPQQNYGKEYDFVFVSPMPPVVGYPPGGINLFYVLSGYLASKGYSVAILNLDCKYRVPERLVRGEKERRRLLFYPALPESAAPFASLAIRTLFSNRCVLKAFEKTIGNDYDYAVLDGVDVLFSKEEEDIGINAKRIFATAWQTAYYVEKYLAGNASARGFYLVQNFEDSAMYSEKYYSSYARRTYGFKDMRKIVVCEGLRKRFGKDSPLLLKEGIDQEVFKRETYPRKRNPRSILFPLRTHISKGSRYALEAAESLHKLSDGYRMVAYGNWPEEDVPDYIEYHYNPTNRELALLCNAASVYMYPAILEGFGLPPLEAMACGCAAVIADSIGINEFARNGRNSLIVPARDSKALSKAVARIAENQRLRNRLARNGRDTAKKFSYKAMCKDFVALVTDFG